MHEDLISSVGLHHTMTLEVKQRERKKGASNKQQTARKKERQFIEEKPWKAAEVKHTDGLAAPDKQRETGGGAQTRRSDGRFA